MLRVGDLFDNRKLCGESILKLKSNQTDEISLKKKTVAQKKIHKGPFRSIFAKRSGLNFFGKLAPFHIIRFIF